MTNQEVKDWLLARGWERIIAAKELGDGKFAAIVPMLVNERIIQFTLDEYSSYDRYWCYPIGFYGAETAFAQWTDPNSEPFGWIKSWDQRRRRYHNGITEQSDEQGMNWQPVEDHATVQCNHN